MTIELDGPTCDSEAARLLPWLVVGRLDAADAARVEGHIATCPVCRAERDAQLELRALIRPDDRLEYSPQPSLQKLMSRIDEMDREMTSPHASTGPLDAHSKAAPRVAWPRWLMAALVVQTVGIGLLGSVLWRNSAEQAAAPRYTTLTAAQPTPEATPRVRVVFTADTTVASLADVVNSVRGTIVAGPSEAGAYTLALTQDRSDDDIKAHLAMLRADSRVLFAEPVVVLERQPR